METSVSSDIFPIFAKTAEKIPENLAAQQTENYSTDFVSSPEDLSSEYILPAEQKGLFILFNHKTFKDDPENKYQRIGTEKDVSAIVQTLANLKFHIDEDNIHHDKSSSQIMDILRQVSQMNLKDRHSLIVIFLTHGYENGCLKTYDGEIKSDDVWSIFQNCEDLIGKPKIFIFQACKGEYISKAYDNLNEKIVSNDSFREKIALGKYNLPVEADFLISFSTVEGNQAFREDETGSWFIQDLCNVIKNYGRLEDFISILTIVTKHVGFGRKGVDKDQNKAKQIPTFLSTLTKKYYLCRPEDRVSYINKNLHTSVKTAISQMNPAPVHISNIQNCNFYFPQNS